jgi:hypothetical protein
MKAQLEHPRLLPGVLIPDPDADPRRRTTRDWMVDVLVFAVAVIGGLVVFADAESHGMSDTLQLIDLAGGTVVCLARSRRRRRPPG